MKLLTILFFLFLSGCTSQKAATPAPNGPELKITEINPNKWTALTRQNLEHLLSIYDLTPVIFTYDIQIESRVIPHSHPVLTLNTRYAEKPHKLLSVFIHEQLHWWVEGKVNELTASISELRQLFPTLPTQGVAKSDYSTYLHLIVCFLEYESLVHYMGATSANIQLDELIHEEKIYPWIYTQVKNRKSEIGRIVEKNNLKPVFLQKPTKKPPFS